MKYKILLLLTFLCAVPVYSQTAEEHFIKALELFKVSDYNKAKISSEKAIAIFKRDNIFPETYFLAVLLTAKCYEFLFEYDPAIELLEIAKKSYNENEDQIFALIISNLSSLYYAKFDFKKSETLMLEAIKVREKVLGKEHPDYSISINNLAELYRSIGDYAKAEQLFLEAMEINHKIFGEEHPAYALSLNNLAYLYYSMKCYSKAEPLFLQAIQIRKIALGEFDLNYALSLNNLAGLYSSIGNYTKAELLFLDIIRIYKIIFGEGHPDYARSLHNLASLYKSMGKNKDAEQLYLSAIEIRRKVLGIDHPDYASSLNNLAVLYNAMGKYSIAEPLFFEAIRIRKMVLGEENIDYATSLNDLAMLYSSMYNFSRAEPLYLEAMKIKKKVLGNEHPDYATILNNLALLYSSMGNYAKAEPMYLEAMGVLKKVLGSEHPDFAISLNNLAGIYQSMGSYLKSEPLYLEAMGVYKKVLGIENPDYATCLNNFAHLYKSIDNYSKAEQMYLESMEIRKKVLGIDHPDYALSLNNLAVLYSSMGKNEEAYPLLETALAVTQKQVKNTFTALSETEKTIFSKKNDHYYDISLSRSSFIPNVKSKSIYDRLLFRKGLILNSSINTRTFITSSNDEKLKQKYSDWLSVKHIINNLYSKTLEQRANSGYNLDSLENYANTIEKDLSKISSTFKDFVMIPDYKWEDVQKNLKHDEAIVDLVKFRFYNKRWTDTTRYGVFVTRFDSKEPEYFEFKDGNRIDTLVIPKFNEKNKNRFADVDTSKDEGKVIVLNQNEELDYYSELFAPIAQHLKGIKKIYLSLDGEFFKVNFNTVKNPETNKYLIEEYEIVYVSSANEIAKGKTETTTNKTAVLAGFPNYDLSLDSLTAIVKSEQRSDENRDIYVNTSNIKQFNLDMLPGTKDEVTVTTDLLKQNGWTVDSWLFNQATESNIKNVIAPGILSISTHGYFSPSPKADYKESFFMGSETKKAVENPLLRSGLFLTGAETFLNSDETQKEKFAENGILTAYEASQLNLFGTDLVILSACETGLGEVNNGEGVFGLQRGFLGAGAKSVLMSLWKVDDTATKDLMIEFIKNYSTTLNKQKSLRDAQLTIMKKYPHPYYWGAFVMVGD